MKDTTILQDSYIYTQGCKHMLGQAFYNFLDNIIREYAVYKNDGYHLYVSKLDHSDKKTFLSYIVDSEDYKYYISNNIREHQAFSEYNDLMQSMLEHRMVELYHHDMQEMGMVLKHHKDNGEPFYIKR